MQKDVFKVMLAYRPMGTRFMLPTWLISFLSKLTGEAIKGGIESAGTVTEIPKNIAETEKARLEIIELKRTQEEHKARIVPASFEDVKEFDPKFKKLKQFDTEYLVKIGLLFALIAFGATAGMQSLSDAINSVFTNISGSQHK